MAIPSTSETEAMARRLAALRGQSVEEAVAAALRAELARAQSCKPGRGYGLAADLLAIGAQCAAAPDLDRRSADEIVWYDEHGLPR